MHVRDVCFAKPVYSHHHNINADTGYTRTQEYTFSNSQIMHKLLPLVHCFLFLFCMTCSEQVVNTGNVVKCVITKKGVIQSVFAAISRD